MTEQIDIVFALIIRENKKLVVGAAYILPDDQVSLDLQLKSQIFCVAFCNEHYINILIFMGDFTCPNEAWNDTTRTQNGLLLHLHKYIELAEHLTVANPNTPTFSCINGPMHNRPLHYQPKSSTFLEYYHDRQHNWTLQRCTQSGSLPSHIVSQETS